LDVDVDVVGVVVVVVGEVAILRASSLQVHENMHSYLPQCAGAKGFRVNVSQTQPILKNKM
jgi:hypothetical protein